MASTTGYGRNNVSAKNYYGKSNKYAAANRSNIFVRPNTSARSAMPSQSVARSKIQAAGLKNEAERYAQIIPKTFGALGRSSLVGPGPRRQDIAHGNPRPLYRPGKITPGGAKVHFHPGTKGISV